MAVVGGLVLLGFIFLGVVGAIFSDAVEDATTVGVPGTSAEVTLAEYDRIEEGMTLQDVEAVVGGKGALSSSAKSDEYVIETYSWAGAPIGSTATVTFTGGRVTNKAQYGLS
jgi:hypothetical protein